MEPGDQLYIPPFHFHSVEVLGNESAASTNVYLDAPHKASLARLFALEPPGPPPGPSAGAAVGVRVSMGVSVDGEAGVEAEEEEDEEEEATHRRAAEAEASKASAAACFLVRALLEASGRGCCGGPEYALAPVDVVRGILATRWSHFAYDIFFEAPSELEALLLRYSGAGGGAGAGKGPSGSVLQPWADGGYACPSITNTNTNTNINTSTNASNASNASNADRLVIDEAESAAEFEAEFVAAVEGFVEAACELTEQVPRAVSMLLADYIEVAASRAVGITHTWGFLSVLESALGATSRSSDKGPA